MTTKRPLQIFSLIWVIFLLLLKSCTGGESLRFNREERPIEKKTETTEEKKTSSLIRTMQTEGRPELRFFVSPVTKSLRPKVSIPKNYNKILYLAGNNFSILRDKQVWVRFKFGVSLTAVTVSATVTRTSDLVPQTEADVLALDLAEAPFSQIKLLYDLYDYTAYTSTTNPEYVYNASEGDLYCRGLSLAYDPTYSSVDGNDRCDHLQENCLYAYAKIADAGYKIKSTQVFLNPTLAQKTIEGGTSYNSDSLETNLKKCLLNRNQSDRETLLFPTPNGAPASALYEFAGPYRVLNQDQWAIEGDALLGTKGLFKSQTLGIFYQSFLFPIEGKIPLRASLEHIGATTSNTDKSLQASSSQDGTTQWVDGCNLRVSYFDSASGEGIQSCSVTATIEILVKDASSGELVALPSEEGFQGTTKVKLQLLREGQLNTSGQETLHSALRFCQDSKGCSADECCVNTKCWARSLVGNQCPSELSAQGQLAVGEACTSDYQCQSYCCAQSSGRCGEHTDTQEKKVFCGKLTGQTCLSDRWCQKISVPQQFIIKTGVDEFGNTLCAKATYYVPTFGQCISGICHPPKQPPAITFNPSAPNACATAITPPSPSQLENP